MKVLLVDDHPLFLDGLRNLLAARGVTVVGTAADGLEALEKARALHPDVVLMDIHMPRLNGLAALRMIKVELPQTRIVMLSMSAEDDELFSAIVAGASGYLLKTQDTDEVFALLQEVECGEVALSPGLASRVLNEFRRRAELPPGVEVRRPAESLSLRETQVLTLVAQGLTYKEVGAKLNLSERTIKYHMGEIVGRLHLEGRAEAIEYARRAGLTGTS
jgi:two-component system NarL family response regulator